MAKHGSPIRLEKTLMEEAQAAGKIMHRSTAETIEYWANIGRQASNYLDPLSLANISIGTARIVVENLKDSHPVAVEDVFSDLESQRASGALAHVIAAKHPVRYQASTTHPGFLDRIDTDGEITVGTFSNGEFVALEAA